MMQFVWINVFAGAKCKFRLVSFPASASFDAEPAKEENNFFYDCFRSAELWAELVLCVFISPNILLFSPAADRFG